MGFYSAFKRVKQNVYYYYYHHHHHYHYHERYALLSFHSFPFQRSLCPLQTGSVNTVLNACGLSRRKRKPENRVIHRTNIC